MFIDVPLAAQLSRAMSIDMAPGAQLSRAMSIDMAPRAQLLCSGGMSIDVPLAAQPLFLRQRIGVAVDAATRAECHVNGHGTTTRPHPLTWHRGRSLVGPCPLTWHRGRSFYVVVACPLTCHSRRSRVFLRQRIGVAADVATRAECHVNGHGTTKRPHPLTCHLRRSLVGRSFYVVVACPLTCHSRRGRVFFCGKE